MLDAEKGEGRGLAKRYGVSSYPTFQLVNAEGATISRWIGYDKAEVMENVDAGVADPTPIEARRARFERKARSADALALGRYHRALMDYARAGDFLRQAQELAEDPAVDHRYEIFETQVLGYRSNSVPLDAVREAADAVVAHERRAPEHVVRVAAHMTQMGRAADDPDLMDAYLKAAMEVTENTDDDWLQSARGELEIEHALFELDDAARGVVLRKKMMPEGWQYDAEQLNNFAWWCAENGVNLEEAAALAEKAIELAENRRTKANVLDTLAEIRHAQGDHAGAVRSIEAALEEAPNWSHLSKQLARFKQAAAEQRLNDE